MRKCLPAAVEHYRRREESAEKALMACALRRIQQTIDNIQLVAV